ncbi:MAG: hypothetical protein R3336_02255, partial [Phycisphaeraceae bacterium]|nr:hypothetical protein [Phycisphaeraceae bacterium]
MNRNRIIQLLAIAVAVGAIAVGRPVASRVADQRQDLKLGLAAGTLENVPWHLTIANAALGSFRGLAADLLWHRAHYLKQAGQYYEANQLSEWITTLQPQFPQVWAFHAWNMAYNISVATYTPEERWSWVSKGINLLREKGVKYNPNGVRIYRELGWIFFHKIGRMSDDMHWHYKKEMAREWGELLGAPKVGASAEETIERFRTVAEAPDSLEALVEAEPGVVKWIKQIQSIPEADYELNSRLLRQIGGLRMVAGADDLAITGLDVQKMASRLGYDSRLLPVARPETESGRRQVEALLAFLRKQVLKREYNMDARRMLENMEEFGPFDWRHPAAHAFYWGYLGTEKAVDARAQENIDALNTYRQNIHCIQMMTGYGRIGYDRVSGYIDLMPDPRFFPYYDKWMVKAQEEVQAGNFRSTTVDSFEHGHENFLHRAVTYTYLYGDKESAAETY